MRELRNDQTGGQVGPTTDQVMRIAANQSFNLTAKPVELGRAIRHARLIARPVPSQFALPVIAITDATITMATNNPHSAANTNATDQPAIRTGVDLAAVARIALVRVRLRC